MLCYTLAIVVANAQNVLRLCIMLSGSSPIPLHRFDLILHHTFATGRGLDAVSLHLKNRGFLLRPAAEATQMILVESIWSLFWLSRRD
jgi:hypothetical protein